MANIDTDLQLGDVADIRVVDGPSMIKSENARINGWVYITANDRALAGYVEEADKVLRERVHLPPGYTYEWAGHYQLLQQAQERIG